MKKIKILLFFMSIILYLLGGQAFAQDLRLEIQEQAIKNGQEFPLVLSVDNLDIVTCRLKITFDLSKLEYVSGPENANVVDDTILYVWYDETGGMEQRTQGFEETFIFRAKQTGVCYFEMTAEAYGKDEQVIPIEKMEKGISIENEIQNVTLTGLKSMYLDCEGITPMFANDIYEYYLQVPSSMQTINVHALPENTNASTQITGNENLQLGVNTIQVIVTEEEKTVTYTIYVTKTDDMQKANTNLETLSIENVSLNPSFENAVTQYKAEVSENTEQIHILAIPENKNSRVEIQNQSILQYGDNVLQIEVLAENGITQKTYSIDVYKRNPVEEEKFLQEQKENEEQFKKLAEEKGGIENIIVNPFVVGVSTDPHETVKAMAKEDNLLDENDEIIQKAENTEEKSSSNFVIWVVAVMMILVFIICLIWNRKKIGKLLQKH